jgi:lysozyme
MTRQKKILLIAAAAGALYLLYKLKAYEPILKTFLPPWEGFSATPYWDYKQWSWGYGTRVPGSVNDQNVPPGGRITRTQAMIDALKHVDQDYLYLKPMIKVPLTGNQWAALLSFSYNLGKGNADNLVANINSGNVPALEKQWKLYVNAGGQPNQQLINRRAAEWRLYEQGV